MDNQNYYTYKRGLLMNIKSIFYLLMVIVSAVNLYSSQTNRQSSQSQLSLEELRLQWLLDRGKPRDKNKIPTSPDIIEHGGNMLKGGQNFYRKRIYFGTLPSGESHYARISDHLENPQFKGVQVIIQKKVSYFTLFLSYVLYLNVNTDDYFEHVGTIGDEIVQRKLIRSISRNGGVWCPGLGFVGGTREKGVCELTDEFKELERQVESQQKAFDQQVKLQQKISKL